MFIKKTHFIALLLTSGILVLQACSGNTFHLRKNIDLSKAYQRIQLENISNEHDFVTVFEDVLEESGGRLIKEGNANKIGIHNFREGKRVVAYTKERKALEYLLYLKLEYSINSQKHLKHKREKINIDKIFVYDPNYALGKAEEEKRIRKSLYKEAARLMLLKLQYSKK